MTLEHLLKTGNRQVLETQLLPDYLMRQRWYAAKDAGRPSVRLGSPALIKANGGAAVVTNADVLPPNQPAQTYFLPITFAADDNVPAHVRIGTLTLNDHDARLIDAVADDSFIRTLIGGLTGENTRALELAGLRFARTSAMVGEVLPDRSQPITRGSTEQSNTSVRIGNVMLKLFRRLHIGDHPEIEMTGFLTEYTSFRNSPVLLGWIEQSAGADTTMVIAALQTWLPNQGDAWALTLALLERAAGPENDSQARDRLLALAVRLGQRTAELHHALAAPQRRSAAFAPEPIGPDHLAAWHASVRSQAEAAFGALRRASNDLSGNTRADLERVLEHEANVYQEIQSLTADPIDAHVTRLHNDFHLGQVLVSDDDVFIIDFEGEPLRPLAERRAKHSPLRDVAGMLRSFHYAAGAVARIHQDTGQETGAIGDSPPDHITSDMSARFLESYLAAAQGCASLPPKQQTDRLLRLFLLEKALYEINYEISNRPDWLDIPLSGLIDLLGGSSA